MGSQNKKMAKSDVLVEELNKGLATEKELERLLSEMEKDKWSEEEIKAEMKKMQAEMDDYDSYSEEEIREMCLKRMEESEYEASNKMSSGSDVSKHKDHDQGKDDLSEEEDDVEEEEEMEEEDDVEEEEEMEEEEEELEESYKAKAQRIFETAVDMKVSSIRESLEKEKEEEVARIAEELEDKIDQYCDHVVSEWLEENQFKVETSLRTEIAENFISGLKDLFSENYFEVPEEKADLCEALGATVSRLKEEKEDLAQEIEIANLEILESKKNSIIEAVGGDLFESQKAKLVKLAESIDASDVDDFEEKLTSIKEVFFSEAASPVKKTNLEESASVQLNEDKYHGNSAIAGYADFLSKTVK